MSRCKSCGKRGLFLKVNWQGLCKSCEKTLKQESASMSKRLIKIEQFEKNHGSILDRYYALNQSADEAYRCGQYAKCIVLCQKNLQLLPQVQGAFRAEIRLGYSDAPPRVPTYKRLAMAYEKQGDINKAIEVCKEAIAKGYNYDGTKEGMHGRIKRLEKKRR